jgi:cAMP-dependent protein kinase regulator
MSLPKEIALKEQVDRLVRERRWEGAIAALGELIQLDPKNQTYPLRRGDYFFKLGQKENAILQYHTAANLHQEAGFVMRALAVYKIILRLNPEEEKAKRCLNELHTLVRAQTAPENRIVPLWKETETVSSLAPVRLSLNTPILLPDGTKSDSTRVQQVAPPATAIPLFAHLSQEEFLSIVNAMCRLQYSLGEKIIKKGDPGNSIFIVCQGTVRVVTYKEKQAILLGELHENHFFGEVAYLTGQPRTADVIAQTDCDLLEIRSALMTEVISAYPRVLKVLEAFHQLRILDMQDKMKDIRGII